MKLNYIIKIMSLMSLFFWHIETLEAQVLTLGNICPNTTVDLTTAISATNLPSGAMVTWHTATPATANNQISNITQVGEGIYYMSFYDIANTCYSHVSQIVMVNITTCYSPITVSNICPNTTVNLLTAISATNTPNGATVTWHTGTPATIDNQVSDPTSISTAGTYYLSFFDAASSCYGPSSQEVTVNINACGACVAGTSSPSLTSTGVNNICPNTTASLIGITAFNQPNGTSLTWHTATPATVANKINDILSLGAGTYYAAFEDASNNCYSPTKDVTITITICTNCAGAETSPSLITTSVSNICPNTTASLIGVVATNQPNGTNLTWHTATPATAANKINNISSLSAGTYYAAFENVASSCYSPTQAIIVNVNPCGSCVAGTLSPSLTSTNVTNMCPNVTANLSGITASNQPSGTSLTWHTTTPATAANKINNVSSLGAGTYYAAFEDASNNCYSPTQAITVTITTCPTSSLPITLSNICPSTTVNLLMAVSATNTPSGTTPTWHTGVIATAGNQVSNPTTINVTGIYYLSFFDPVNNCYSPTQAVTVNINPCGGCVAVYSPSFASTNISNICPNFTANLSSITAFNQPSGTSLTWHTSTPATLANKMNNILALGAGIYYAAFEDASNNCYSPTQAVTVTINACPSLLPIVVTNTCPETTVNLLTAISATNIPSGATITWHTGNPATADNQVADPSSVGTTGTYYLSFFNAANDCYSPISQAVLVNITNCDCFTFSVVCTKTDVTTNGGNNGTASVAATGGASPYNYLWTSGETDASISNKTAGTYGVTVTDNNSCTAACSLTINEPEALPDLSLTKTVNTTTTTLNSTVTFTLTLTNDNSIDATGVVVTDNLPSGLSFVSLSDPANATHSGGVVTWNVGNMLGTDAPKTLQITVTATNEGSFVNTAEITNMNEADFDSDPGNNAPNEDDQGQACFSVPFKLCSDNANASITITSAAASSWQWYISTDGIIYTAMDNETNQNLVINNSIMGGNNITKYFKVAYNGAAITDGCGATMCCPIIVTTESCTVCPPPKCIPITITKN